MSRNQRIVVVNDHTDIRDLIKMVLEGEGYAVDCLTLDQYTPEHLYEPIPDLIIVDLIYGHQPYGRQLIHQLKTDTILAQTPLLICTASIQQLQQETDFLAGQDLPVLLQPFDIDTLIAMVERVLQEHDKQREQKPAHGRGRWPALLEGVTLLNLNPRSEMAQVSPRLLAQALQTLPVALIALNTTGKVTLWNQAAHHYFGWTEQETSGQEIAIVPREQTEQFYDLLTTIIDKQTPLTCEFTFLRKNGTLLETQLTLTPYTDEQGRFLGVFLAIIDISKRKREERLRTTQYTISEILAHENTLANAAPRILQAIGEGLDWGIGVLWQVNLASNTLTCAGTWGDRCIDAGHFLRIQQRMSIARGVGIPGRVWHSGKPAWTQGPAYDMLRGRSMQAANLGLMGSYAFPITQSREVVGVIEFFCRKSRQPAEAMLAFFQATGAQIGLFLARLRTEQALRDREQRLRRMVEISGIGLMTCDAGMRILDATENLISMLGYERVEFDPLRLKFNDLVAPGYREKAEAFLQALLAGDEQISVELTLLAKNGDTRHVLTGGAGIDETRKLVTVFILDISHHRMEPAQVPASIPAEYEGRLFDILRLAVIPPSH